MTFRSDSMDVFVNSDGAALLRIAATLAQFDHMGYERKGLEGYGTRSRSIKVALASKLNPGKTLTLVVADSGSYCPLAFYERMVSHK